MCSNPFSINKVISKKLVYCKFRLMVNERFRFKFIVHLILNAFKIKFYTCIK